MVRKHLCQKCWTIFAFCPNFIKLILKTKVDRIFRAYTHIFCRKRCIDSHARVVFWFISLTSLLVTYLHNLGFYNGFHWHLALVKIKFVSNIYFCIFKIPEIDRIQNKLVHGSIWIILVNAGHGRHVTIKFVLLPPIPTFLSNICF